MARTAAKALDPMTRLAGFSPARFASAFLPHEGHTVIPTPEFLAAEVPAVNGVFTARSLARLYAALGSVDGLDGVQLWSDDTRRTATRAADPTPRSGRSDCGCDGVSDITSRSRPSTPRRQRSGSTGRTGRAAYADPDRRLAVGFVGTTRQGACRSSNSLVRSTPQLIDSAHRADASMDVKRRSVVVAVGFG